jgi:hypothetical protein
MESFASRISGAAMLALAALPIAALATASHAQTVVKAEFSEKLAVLNTAQLSHAAQTFAAR